MLFLLLLAASSFLDVEVRAQYPGCDYFQQMQLNTDYYVYSNGYPNNYPPGSSCRWYAQAPNNAKINIDCKVELPPSTNCNGDRLMVSTTGRTDLQDAQRYCGNGSFKKTSTGNLMNIVLYATPQSQGGRFLCTIRAFESGTPGCDCGWKKTTRIVGGVETGVNEYPMMAGLVDMTNRNVFCGGTIISNTYIVTAAHCVLNRALNGYAILIGDHDVQSGTETNAAQLIYPASVLIHERFDTTTYQNDIAIIRTNRVMEFSQRIGPACLPFNFRNSNFAGTSLTALGWGTTQYAGPTSNVLLKVQLEAQTNEQCSPHYPGRLGSGQICTYAPGKDSCQNDSGGPLCYEDPRTGRVQLVGIISYSNNGCATKTPGVNTRITSYIDWIQRNTPDVSYCVK